MFRVILFLVLIFLLFGLNSYAIDKTSSKKAEVKTSDNPVTLEGEKLAVPGDSTTTPSNQPTDNKDYNDFVDTNNNGIDDRAETKRINIQTAPESKSSQTDEISANMVSPDSMLRIRRYFDSKSRGGQFLIEKTVSNCLRIPAVDKVFPDSRYIHLYRNGWDVVESVYRQWIAPPHWGYIVHKAISFPVSQAFRYATSYATKLLQGLDVRGNGVSGSWGPRYRGIDDDVLTGDPGTRGRLDTPPE